MKLLKTSILLLILPLALVACGGDNNINNVPPHRAIPQMIDVQIYTESEHLISGVPVEIKAKVTLEGENVENADEVEFEIWAGEDKDNSYYVEGVHEGEGVYSVTETFEEDGIYYAISHVTLREMHNMPRLMLVVGDVPDVDPNQQQEEQHEHGIEMDDDDEIE